MTRAKPTPDRVIRKRRWYGAALALLGVLIIVQFWFHPDQPAREVATAVGWHDGKLTVRNDREQTYAVGLLGVRPLPGKEMELSKVIHNQVVGRMITLVRDSPDSRPTEATIYCDGELFNAWLIDQGYADVDPSDAFVLRDLYLRLAGWAKRDGRGFHAN